MEITKPYNEHSCRIKDPEDFKEGSFRRVVSGNTFLIVGKLKRENKTTLQAIRYPKDKFTEENASNSCKEHKGEFESAKKGIEKQEEVEIFFPIKSITEDKQIVYGVVYEPEIPDKQGDYATVEDIEKAAHDFMEEYRSIKVQHEQEINAYPIESYIAPVDFTLEAEFVRKGSWVMVVKVKDTDVWKGIKEGVYTGFSLGGTATYETPK
ncbi:MAG: hypothetical protein KJ621_21130 [Proteobacteria bacterium]|nr:hypothetical protein [Pseudomonadota bacterium]